MQDVDISGLPLFYVNKIITTKMEDGNLMVVCGIKRGTEFMPLYATIRPAEVAIEDRDAHTEPDRLACETSH